MDAGDFHSSGNQGGNKHETEKPVFKSVGPGRGSGPHPDDADSRPCRRSTPDSGPAAGAGGSPGSVAGPGTGREEAARRRGAQAGPENAAAPLGHSNTDPQTPGYQERHSNTDPQAPGYQELFTSAAAAARAEVRGMTEPNELGYDQEENDQEEEPK